MVYQISKKAHDSRGIVYLWRNLTSFDICEQAITSSYFLSDSSAMSFAWESWASRIATRSSSMLVLFSSALRILVSAEPNTCVL